MTERCPLTAGCVACTSKSPQVKLEVFIAVEIKTCALRCVNTYTLVIGLVMPALTDLIQILNSLFCAARHYVIMIRSCCNVPPLVPK